MQDAYDEYCEVVRGLHSDEFWRLFATLYRERVGIIDRVLQTTREVFVHEKEMKRRFPISTRQIHKQAVEAAGDFTCHIMHEIDVDVSMFDLPDNVNPFVKFRFINPLWAWIQAANDMVAAGHCMSFKPKVMLNTRGERLYGSGVQFGDAIKFACARTPRGRLPALFGISFDGGDSGVSNRSVYPICVSALNFNGSNPMQCGLVGFIPQIEVATSFKETETFRAVRAHILQECIGAVLDELDNVVDGGFTAYVGKRLLHFQPFLLAVRVDSKERKSYFGLKSDRYTYMCTRILSPIYVYTYIVAHM